MADDRPVLNQINLVVRDMDAMTEFYGKLGAEIAPTAPPWIGITGPFQCPTDSTSTSTARSSRLSGTVAGRLARRGRLSGFEWHRGFERSS